MTTRNTRLTLYGIILGLAICVTAVGILLESDLADGQTIFILIAGRQKYFFEVRSGIVASVFAFLTMVWTSILMAWNDKPRSESGLAISLTHYISFVIMSVIWLALAITQLTETADTCQLSKYPDPFGGRDDDFLNDFFSWWCGEVSTMGALSLAISIFSGATALFIFFTSRKVGGLQSKLVAPDGDVQLREMRHATRVRTALYSLILVFGLAINVMAPFSIIATVEESFFNTGSADTAFVIVALLCSLFTWIWASVLLAYHRRISPKNPMTRASAHCISTMVLGTVWFVLGVIILGFTSSNCVIGIDELPFGYCEFTLPVGALSLCLSVLLDSVSLFIRFQIKNGGGTLYKSHVAQFDGGGEAKESVVPQYHSHPHLEMLPVSGSAGVLPSCHACHHHQHHSHPHLEMLPVSGSPGVLPSCHACHQQQHHSHPHLQMLPVSGSPGVLPSCHACYQQQHHSHPYLEKLPVSGSAGVLPSYHACHHCYHHGHDIPNTQA